MCDKVIIKDLKVGDFFILSDCDCPKESQVFVRGEYDRSERRYSCSKWSDFCSDRLFKGDKVVYVGFTF